MKALSLLLLLTTLPCAFSWGQASTTYTRRGAFSLSFPVSYLETRLLNSDGSQASYKGGQGGLGLDVQVWGEETSEVRLFGSYMIGETKGDPSSNTAKRDESFFGLKVFPNSKLFLAAGLGRLGLRVQNAGSQEAAISANIAGLGVGAEFPIGTSWYAGFGAWYKTGSIKQNENPSIGHNSSADSTELQLMLIWSPPASTTNISRPR